MYMDIYMWIHLQLDDCCIFKATVNETERLQLYNNIMLLLQCNIARMLYMGKFGMEKIGEFGEL